MSSDSDNNPENGNDISRSPSTSHSSKISEAGEESPIQKCTPDCEDGIELNRTEGDNFNYMVPGQMEIKDECDSKSDEEKEKSSVNNMETNQMSKDRSRSKSRSDKGNSVTRKKNTSTGKQSMSPSKKQSRSSSRGKSRSHSRKRSRSRNRRSRSHSRKHSRSRSRRRSRSTSRRRSRSPSRRRYSRRSNSWSRRRRGRRSRSGTPPDGARLHVAEIDVDTSKRDLERLFGKFGRLREVWMAHNPPCFAFVVFDRLKDAEDAQRETNGEQLGRSRIRVTLARPRTRGGKFRGAYDPNMRCYQCGEIGHFSRNCTDTKFGYKRPPSPVGRRTRRRSRSNSRSRRS